MEKHFHLLLVVALFLWTIKQSSAVDFNITLNRTLLSAMGELNIVRLSSGRLYCLPGQEDWNVYVIPANAFNTCTTDTTGFKSIGGCSNPYLNIAIITTAIELPGIPSFESGNDYYFSAYEVSAGQIVSNDPCLDGYKFSFRVVEQLDQPSSISIGTSTQSLEISSSEYLSSFASSISPTAHSEPTSITVEPVAVGNQSSSLLSYMYISTASNTVTTITVNTVTTITVNTVTTMIVTVNWCSSSLSNGNTSSNTESLDSMTTSMNATPDTVNVRPTISPTNTIGYIYIIIATIIVVVMAMIGSIICIIIVCKRQKKGKPSNSPKKVNVDALETETNPAYASLNQTLIRVTEHDMTDGYDWIMQPAHTHTQDDPT